MKKNLFLMLLFPFLLFLNGCAARVNSTVAPNFEISKLKTFYVKKFDSDERGIEKMIAAQLNKMGYTATAGPEKQAGTNVDAIVTYEDRWMWDITMYMLEIKIFIREPQTDFVLASGYSYRTSLARKEPEFMIEEAMNKIYGLPQPVSE